MQHKSIYEGLELLPEDLQGWNGNSPIFRRLIEKVKPTTIIECGTWKGQSAITMAKVVSDLNLPTKIYCVDTWLGAREFIDDDSPERNLMLKNGYPQVYYQFLSNVVHNNAQSIISPLPTTTTIAAKYFKDNGITAQLIYIDASHDPQDVQLDLANYYPLVTEHGILFGDDFTWNGMEKTISQFCKNNKASFYVLENNFWVIERN